MRGVGSSGACRRRLRAAVVVAAACWPGGRGGGAEELPGERTGPGLATCGQAAHLKHENPAMADGFFAWAEGFMSGLNDK